MSNESLTPEDKRMVIEGRLLNIFTDKRFGGKRIVEAPIIRKMQQEIIDEFLRMRDEGLL